MTRPTPPRPDPPVVITDHEFQPPPRLALLPCWHLDAPPNRRCGRPRRAHRPAGDRPLIFPREPTDGP